MIKLILSRLTKLGTFPNVILKGKSLGGSEDIVRLYDEGTLKGKFEDAGIVVTESGRP